MLAIKTTSRLNGKLCIFACIFAATTVALWAFFCADAGAQVLSEKRGFADTNANFTNLQTTNAGWYYRWGPTKPGGAGATDAKFLPMFWNGGQVTQGNINTIIGYGDVEWVLGFNEPERDSQANMTVAQAISAWDTLTDGFAGTGIKLASPAVSDGGDGPAWLADFMGQVNARNSDGDPNNDLQVDAIAYHWYGVANPNDPVGAANQLLNKVNQLYSQYGRPIFFTEFALHDWGGMYSDEEMRNANAIFLDTLIPAFESDPRVAGYSFYHWFGDASLYEGNPQVPTNVGEAYVGTINSGTVYNFSGDDLGQHVAYLNGGELTLSGAAGAVRYINVLNGVGTISGSTNWALNATTNWVRVQPGATLRKEGSNQITWNGITVTNNGMIDVADGILRLQNNVIVNGTGKFRVSTGGTLSLSGTPHDSSVVFDYDVELRGGTLSTDMADGFFAVNGTTLSGEGTVVGDFTALSGSTIRVGGEGLPVSLSQFVIDDFESYGLGNVRDVANPPWTAHGGGSGTQFADIESDAGNHVLTYGWSSEARGTSRDMPEEGQIEDGETATFFFRFNSKTDDPDHNFGLAADVDTSADADFSDFEAQFRIVQGTTGGTVAVNARDGGGFTANLAANLSLNTWYNVWMVVDQTTDTYDVYMNTGPGDATGANLLASGLGFRNGSTSAALDKILGLAGDGGVDNGVRFDDLTYLDGMDLTNPLGGLNPQSIFETATMTVNGDVAMSTGATLELGIYTPAVHDVLDVTGTFTADGILNVMLADGVPAPGLGDAFDLIDFASAGGAFDTLNLPALTGGLVWDTSNLLTTGTIAVVSTLVPGDADGDGDVDFDDYNILSGNMYTAVAGGASDGDFDNDGDVDFEDFVIQALNFGDWPSAEETVGSLVPEPGSVTLLALMTVTLLSRAGRVVSNQSASRDLAFSSRDSLFQPGPNDCGHITRGQSRTAESAILT